MGKKDHKVPEWKKLNSKELGISTSMIAKPTKKVLNGLKQRGTNFVAGFLFTIIYSKIPSLLWLII